MTTGASPKARILESLSQQHKTLDESESTDEFVDPGALLIARAILLLVEVELLR